MKLVKIHSSAFKNKILYFLVQDSFTLNKARYKALSMFISSLAINHYIYKNAFDVNIIKSYLYQWSLDTNNTEILYLIKRIIAVFNISELEKYKKIIKYTDTVFSLGDTAWKKQDNLIENYIKTNFYPADRNCNDYDESDYFYSIIDHDVKLYKRSEVLNKAFKHVKSVEELYYDSFLSIDSDIYDKTYNLYKIDNYLFEVSLDFYIHDTQIHNIISNVVFYTHRWEKNNFIETMYYLYKNSINEEMTKLLNKIVNIYDLRFLNIIDRLINNIVDYKYEELE